jgi:hypothetical protein
VIGIALLAGIVIGAALMFAVLVVLANHDDGRERSRRSRGKLANLRSQLAAAERDRLRLLHFLRQAEQDLAAERARRLR